MNHPSKLILLVFCLSMILALPPVHPSRSAAPQVERLVVFESFLRPT